MTFVTSRRLNGAMPLAILFASVLFCSTTAADPLLFQRQEFFKGGHNCVENKDESKCDCRDLFSCSDPGLGPRRCGLDGSAACACYRDTENNARCTTGCGAVCTSSSDCAVGEYCVNLGTSSDICPPCGGVLGEAYRVCSKSCPEPFE